MTRQQIILIAVSVVAIVLIYQLPRVVVENETAEQVQSHDFSVTADDEQLFSHLRQQLKEAREIKKIVNFADSLAGLSLRYQLLDSATRYADLILEIDTSYTGRHKAALVYYRAYRTADMQARATELARRAGHLLTGLLDEDPDNVSLKNKLAMTLLVTESPMKGVEMLREALQQDPDNRETLMNLGLLAMQSGQYERALERFARLLELDPADHESLFYLGVSYAETGQGNAARSAFMQLVTDDEVDPALKATASQYIEDL